LFIDEMLVDDYFDTGFAIAGRAVLIWECIGPSRHYSSSSSDVALLELEYICVAFLAYLDAFDRIEWI
jgi:hypothetical protein